MTPPIPRGFLFYTKFDVEIKVHYLVFRVQTVPRKIFGNRRMTVLHSRSYTHRVSHKVASYQLVAPIEKSK